MTKQLGLSARQRCQNFKPSKTIRENQSNPSINQPTRKPNHSKSTRPQRQLPPKPTTEPVEPHATNAASKSETRRSQLPSQKRQVQKMRNRHWQPHSIFWIIQGFKQLTANDGSSRHKESTVRVLEELRQPVLSRSSQQQLGMIPVNYPHVRVHQITDTDRPSNEQRDSDQSKLMVAHPKIFDGTCREMDCEPVHLTLREGAILVQMRGQRNIAEPMHA